MPKISVECVEMMYCWRYPFRIWMSFLAAPGCRKLFGSSMMIVRPASEVNPPARAHVRRARRTRRLQS